jgi:hypothetical protein
MRSTVWRFVSASVITALLLASFSGSVAAHDEGCLLELRDAPIEAVPPMPGWTWREVVITPEGWRGRLEWSGGDLRAASFAISCAVDPVGLFERRAQIRRAMRFEELGLETVVGDETAAWRSGTTATTHLEWRSGSTVGEIVGEWNARLDELAAMAVAFETALSSGVAATPEFER